MLYQAYRRRRDLLGRTKAETTGEDNFETVKLVFSAYKSAGQNTVVRVTG